MVRLHTHTHPRSTVCLMHCCVALSHVLVWWWQAGKDKIKAQHASGAGGSLAQITANFVASSSAAATSSGLAGESWMWRVMMRGTVMDAVMSCHVMSCHVAYCDVMLQ